MDWSTIKKGIYVLIFILISLIGLLALNALNTEPKVSGDISVNNTSTSSENFSEEILNPHTWQITREGDYKDSIVDVYDVNSSENVDYRLRLGLNTIGTRDENVKFLGVRSVEKTNVSNGTEISFDLDWNNQSNGCYLSGSFYLCPTVTGGNPENENNWLKFEYIGVPPGQNARCEIASKMDGNKRLLYTDGWPEKRTGRQIADQHIKIIFDNKSFKVLENGGELNASTLNDLNFNSAYIYLQMSSHSNYPMREIYFDNISFTKR